MEYILNGFPTLHTGSDVCVFSKQASSKPVSVMHSTKAEFNLSDTIFSHWHPDDSSRCISWEAFENVGGFRRYLWLAKTTAMATYVRLILHGRLPPTPGWSPVSISVLLPNISARVWNPVVDFLPIFPNCLTAYLFPLPPHSSISALPPSFESQVFLWDSDV